MAGIEGQDRSGTARRWCILRTAGSRTLPLTESLTAAGFDVWTPSQLRRRRVPRKKAFVFTSYPVLPTFVFARADHVLDLYRLQSLPVSPHPNFSLFRNGLGVPLISDTDVNGLRRVAADMQAVLDGEVSKEQREAMRQHRRDFDVGSLVHTDAGGFAGMTGVVQHGDGKWAWVLFGGQMKVKVDAFLLRTGAVQSQHPVVGVAA